MRHGPLGHGRGANWSRCVWKSFSGLCETTGRLIAVKQILTGQQATDEELANLREEIRLMQRLKHPNIVRYLGTQWDSANKELLIFTEWVPGGSIVEMLQNFKKLSEGIVISYTRQILEGLSYLPAV